MKKILLLIIGLVLIVGSMGYASNATPVNKVEPQISDSSYMYEGTILEIVNNNDQDTEVIDGTLVMEIELDNQKYTIAVHITENESPVALSAYEIGEIVQIITPLEINLEGADEMAHIGVIAVEKFIVDAPIIDVSTNETNFLYKGIVIEVVEGTVVLELEDSTTIFIYITPEMSINTADEYVTGEEVIFTVDYELDFEGAIDVPHVSPLTLEKSN